MLRWRSQMIDKLREELERLSVVYDDARNEFVSSTPDGSARDTEVRRYLLAFTDLYEAALADSADRTVDDVYHDVRHEGYWEKPNE